MPAVASHSSHPAAGATDRSVTAPAGLTTDDLVLVLANTDGAVSLGLTGPGTITDLEVDPGGTPRVHAWAVTGASAGPWTITGGSGEWVHRIAVRITDPGPVTVGPTYLGIPGSTPPNFDAAVIPSTDSPADDTLSIIAGYVINGVDTDPSSNSIAATGALAARWRLVDAGPTGTIEWTPSNIWAAVCAVQILVAPAGDPDPPAPFVVEIYDGTGWQPAAVEIYDGTTWQPADLTITQPNL